MGRISAGDVNSLRSQIGMVLQETTLFAASIRENITFGKPDAARRRSRPPPGLPRPTISFMQMPEGYDTEVGERGVTLSGGQNSGWRLPAPS